MVSTDQQISRGSRARLDRRRALLGGVALVAGGPIVMASLGLPRAAFAQEKLEGGETADETGKVSEEAKEGPADLLITRSRLVEIKGKDGQALNGFLAHPPLDDGSSWPAVLLVHDRWGLTEEITATAEALAGRGFIVLALDLYDGLISREAKVALFKARNLDQGEIVDTLSSWVDWARAMNGASGKIGLCGWGFGGSWALDGAMVLPIDAAVVYYADVRHTVEELRGLKGPVLGHFGTRDLHINRAFVEEFADNMKRAGRVAEINWYEASNNFAMPFSTHFYEEGRDLAWTRTVAFFQTYLAS